MRSISGGAPWAQWDAGLSVQAEVAQVLAEVDRAGEALDSRCGGLAQLGEVVSEIVREAWIGSVTVAAADMAGME